MRLAIAVLILTTLLATACSSGSSDAGGAAPQAETLSIAECRQIFEKSMQLRGMPAETFASVADQAARECHASRKATQDDLRCALAASTMDQLQACRIDVSL